MSSERPSTGMRKAALLSLVLASCTTDIADGAQAEADETVTEADEADETATESDATESTTDEDPSQAWVPARGIEIVEVEASQATRVPIGLAAGAWVGPEARVTPLVGGRRTLLRVHYEVAPGFAPHEVEAWLRIDRLDGESLESRDVIVVEGSSERADTQTTFDFTLEPEWSAPGATYVVELRERAGDQQAELPQLAASNPSEGPRPIGFESDPMEIEIVVAPIHYLDLDTLPAIDQTQLDALGEALYEQLPVQRVSLSLGETIPYSGAPEIQPILDAVFAARSAAQVDLQVYYMGIIDCGEPGCDYPQTAFFLANPESQYRASMLALDYFDAANMLLVLGVNQGLRPHACPGFDETTDPSYPYPEGVIGNWGANTSSGEVYPPDSTYDFMTYCTPSWVSDVSYRASFERVRTLTQWSQP